MAPKKSKQQKVNQERIDKSIKKLSYTGPTIKLTCKVEGCTLGLPGIAMCAESHLLVRSNDCYEEILRGYGFAPGKKK